MKIRTFYHEGETWYSAYDVCVLFKMTKELLLSIADNIQIDGKIFVSEKGVYDIIKYIDDDPNYPNYNFCKWKSVEFMGIENETSTMSIFKYNGNNVTFVEGNNGLMVNATEMAKVFDKKCNDWLRTEQSKRMIQTIATSKKCDVSDLVVVVNGGNSGNKTWMHEDVALVFAQWLSPEFYLWCNDRVKELMTQGVATLNNDDETILNAINILQKRIESKDKEIKVMRPYSDYAQKVLDVNATYTLTEIANELKIRNVNRFINELHCRGIIYKGHERYMTYADYTEKGYFTTRTKIIKINDKDVSKTYLVVTEEGRKFLHEQFNY